MSSARAGLGGVLAFGLLLGAEACTVFAGQPPCQEDSNCLPDQVCDLSSSSCVPREAAESDGGTADAGRADAELFDSAGADVVAFDSAIADSATTDSAAVDSARVDSAVPDTASLDAAAPDTTPLDAALPDAAGPESRCDDLDNDGDGLVDEGCDDDLDGHCDADMTVIGAPAVCPDSPPGTADDCDDTIPDCVSDCTTNTDGDVPPVVDCVERFCGSDPAVLASVCLVAGTRDEINDAIDQANQGDGEPDFILLGDMTVDDDLTTITSADGVTIRQRAGTAVMFDSGADAEFLRIEGDDVTIDGVHLVEVARCREWIEFRGVSGTLQHSVIEGFGHRGVKIAGALHTLIVGNVIIGGGVDDNDNRAAINIDTSDFTTIVGNVLAQNNCGVSIKAADSLRIDHNTLADNTYWGLHFYDTDSTEVCARNNAVSGNGIAIGFNRSATWDEGAGCVGPLDDTGAGARYGNLEHNNAALCDGSCAGVDEVSCQLCLPASADTFWELAVTPEYATTTHGHAGFYCPGAAAMIDGGDVLESTDPAYDRNGAQAGMFSGAAPDIGGRESGSSYCE